MEYSSIQLNDLPDEIIIIILKKLHNSEVLYSLIGVNKRLHRIANDSIFTSNLTFISLVKKEFRTNRYYKIFTRNLSLIKSFDGISYEFDDARLNRFCLEILPNINEKIKQLTIDSSCMERILCLTTYPNLRTLTLYNLQPETFNDLLCDQSYFIRHYQFQIFSLILYMKEGALRRNAFGVKNINTYIFGKICNMFKNLKYFNFKSSSDYEQLTFTRLSSIEFSSNLLELHVTLDTIIDCLYLLDHLNQLHTMDVMIYPRHCPDWSLVVNNNKVPNLKYFSLIHDDDLGKYKEFLLPLLQKMSNLEELNLCFFAPFVPIIDGNDLKENIINYMSKLNKFSFNIRSCLRLNNQLSQLTNADIQDTFRNFKNNRIVSYVDYFQKGNLFHYQIYSYPYKWTFYDNITNNFPGGLYRCVREISLFDEHPFKHEFFCRITQSFPYLEKLRLHNCEAQEHDNLQSLIVVYPYLTELDLINSHETYIDEFLNHCKTCFLKNIHLTVDYNTLKRATNDFTKEETQFNPFNPAWYLRDEMQNEKEIFCILSSS
ncbi:unnamed protein product [Rotaria sp. Silwood1]|nr:unnamed protein product [Rotaria sp. Silwood1]